MVVVHSVAKCLLRLFTTINKHEIGLCDITEFSRIDLFLEESSCILNFFD
jgi:hypothetical protein